MSRTFFCLRRRREFGSRHPTPVNDKGRWDPETPAQQALNVTGVPESVSQNVAWYVVKTCYERTGLQHIAPHDLRRTCAKLRHSSGGELEQILFLLGHASVQTTERYLLVSPELFQGTQLKFGSRTARKTESTNELHLSQGMQCGSAPQKSGMRATFFTKNPGITFYLGFI
jgi:hypothetical protein